MIVSENDKGLSDIYSINSNYIIAESGPCDNGVAESTVWRKRKKKTLLPNGHATDIPVANTYNREDHL